MSKNGDLLIALYRARDEGHVPTIERLLDGGVQWHVPGRNLLSGRFRGVEETLAHFAAAREVFAGTLGVVFHDVLVSENHTIVLCESEARRNGTIFKWQSVEVFHIAHGRVKDFVLFLTDQYAFDEFFA